MRIFSLTQKIPTIIFAIIITTTSIIATPIRTLAATLSFPNVKSVDVMKYTKDVLTHQPSDSQIQNLVDTLKTLNINYIALSIPMDDTASYPSGMKPSPRTAESFTQKWADAVHQAGLHIIWRGTFASIEGIYNFPKKVGSNRFPSGTASSAASDGGNSWLGKIYQYITVHPSYFADGDMWAPLPERTENIFSDATSFLPYTSPGIQANYANFFNDLKKVSDNAFGSIGKNVITGLTTNNYTEISSTWLPASIFNTANYVVVDYYGSSHSASEMDSDLRAIAAAKGKPIMLQEWGDYWDQNMSQSDRTAYLNSIYSVLQKLVNEGKLIGFNYWGGWDTGGPEGILSQDSSGFHINYAGTILKNFFGANTAVAATVQPPPVQQPVTPPANPPTNSGTTVTCAQPATNAFTGCYYSDQNLSSLTLSRTDTAINFVWDNSSPDPKIPKNNFSVRWQGNFSFNADSYTFTTITDDGARLFIDGEPVISDWQDQPAYPAHTATLNMSAGTHLVTLEYYQNTGGAVAKLSWQENGNGNGNSGGNTNGNSSGNSTSASNQSAPAGFTGNYYKDNNLTQLVLTRNDPSINFTWNDGSPDPSIPADQFSVRWVGDFNFSNGSHTFTMDNDDGARLYIDNNIVINDWHDHAVGEHTYTTNLSGTHNIKMEYYEAYGGAIAKLNWN